MDISTFENGVFVGTDCRSGSQRLSFLNCF